MSLPAPAEFFQSAAPDQSYYECRGGSHYSLDSTCELRRVFFWRRELFRKLRGPPFS